MALTSSNSSNVWKQQQEHMGRQQLGAVRPARVAAVGSREHLAEVAWVSCSVVSTHWRTRSAIVMVSLVACSGSLGVVASVTVRFLKSLYAGTMAQQTRQIAVALGLESLTLQLVAVVCVFSLCLV